MEKTSETWIAEVQEHEISGHEPYRSWCRACVAGRGRADAHVGRRGVEKGVPIIGVDYGHLWSLAAEASDAPHDEVAGQDPPDGVRTLSPVLCGRCSVDRWIFGHICQTKGDSERNRAVLAKELKAGGYPGVVVRSDGELALLAHVKAARAMTMVSEIPLASVHEQLSKEQSPGNGLAEGAVKELHVGRKFRRLVAPWAQKIWWMSAGKHVSRISAESRWQEGIFLGILGGGVGASDYAIGTPDGVQPARAISMIPEINAWDIELLLGLPLDRRRADPAARIRLPGPEVPPEHVLPPPVGEPAGPRSRRVYIGRDVEIRKYGVTIGCPVCMAITAGTTAQGHSVPGQDRAENS